MKVIAKARGQYKGIIREREEIFDVDKLDLDVHPPKGHVSNWWEVVEQPEVVKKSEKLEKSKKKEA